MRGRCQPHGPGVGRSDESWIQSEAKTEVSNPGSRSQRGLLGFLRSPTVEQNLDDSTPNCLGTSGVPTRSRQPRLPTSSGQPTPGARGPPGLPFCLGWPDSRDVVTGLTPGRVSGVRLSAVALVMTVRLSRYSAAYVLAGANSKWSPGPGLVSIGAIYV
jgi:hypothetical protein